MPSFGNPIDPQKAQLAIVQIEVIKKVVATSDTQRLASALEILDGREPLRTGRGTVVTPSEH